jgi:X-X-X-Leu-X-X-Gly heptad repeat protein
MKHRKQNDIKLRFGLVSQNMIRLGVLAAMAASVAVTGVSCAKRPSSKGVKSTEDKRNKAEKLDYALKARLGQVYDLKSVDNAIFAELLEASSATVQPVSEMTNELSLGVRIQFKLKNEPNLISAHGYINGAGDSALKLNRLTNDPGVSERYKIEVACFSSVCNRMFALLSEVNSVVREGADAKTSPFPTTRQLVVEFEREKMEVVRGKSNKPQMIIKPDGAFVAVWSSNSKNSLEISGSTKSIAELAKEQQQGAKAPKELVDDAKRAEEAATAAAAAQVASASGAQPQPAASGAAAAASAVPQAEADKVAAATAAAASAAPAASGAEQAASGAEQAASGAGQAASGAEQAASGAGQAASGAEQAASGAEQAASGAGQAASGAGQAASGAGQAASGTEQAASGTEQAASGTEQAASGTEQAASAAKPAASGVPAALAPAAPSAAAGQTSFEGIFRVAPAQGSFAAGVLSDPLAGNFGLGTYLAPVVNPGPN